MPLYLDTAGNSTRSVAVCDRCKMKMVYDALAPDKNAPGLRVCAPCSDNLDPWRLPARMPENITLRYPRPDTPIPSSSGSAIAGIAVAGFAISGSSL